VLGDVHRERLAQPVGDGDHLVVLLVGTVEVADRDETGDAPLARVDLQLVVADPVGEVARLGEHVQRLRELAHVARPVRADEDLGETLAVVQAPRHRLGGLPHG
jgi:hypothetical protein